MERKRILVITAHPDDADVHAGGTLARWADEGHEIHSAILTRGDKGHTDPGMTLERLAAPFARGSSARRPRSSESPG